MQILHDKPVARGVNQLMYVGDDQAVEPPTTLSTPVKVALVAVGLWLLFRK